MNNFPEKICCHPSAKEYIQAGRQTGRLPSRSVRNIILTLLMLVCEISFFQQYIIPKNSQPDYFLGTITLIIPPVVIALIWIMPSKEENRFANRLLSEGQTEIVFAEDGITVKSDISDYRFRSENRLIWKYGKEMISVYEPEQDRLIVIPARSTDSENYTVIYEYLKENFKLTELD